MRTIITETLAAIGFLTILAVLLILLVGSP